MFYQYILIFLSVIYYIINTDSYNYSLHLTFNNQLIYLIISSVSYETSILKKLINKINIEFINEESLKIPRSNNFFYITSKY